MKPRADVIMPIRNGMRFIGPALESILADDALGALIIIDDGSTDGWRAAAGPLLRKATIITRPPEGIASALNTGLAHSTATYVARMDADDISIPGRLAAQIDYLQQHPTIAAAGTQVEDITESGRPLRRSNYPTHPHQLRHHLFDRGRCTVTHSSVMMRRQAIINMGGYREPYLHAEDFDLWLRLSEHHAIANLNGCFLRYRIHSDQVSKAHNIRQCFTRDLALLSARERAAGRPDPTEGWTAPRSYGELAAGPAHPVIRTLARAYDAIEHIHADDAAMLAPDALRAIPTLACQSYLGQARRLRYDLIKKAGHAALKRGNLSDALQAYYALARCRTADSRYFRKPFREATP